MRGAEPVEHGLGPRLGRHAGAEEGEHDGDAGVDAGVAARHGAQRADIAGLADEGEAPALGEMRLDPGERRGGRVARAGSRHHLGGGPAEHGPVADRIGGVGRGLQHELDRARLEKMDEERRERAAGRGGMAQARIGRMPRPAAETGPPKRVVGAPLRRLVEPEPGADRGDAALLGLGQAGALHRAGKTRRRELDADLLGRDRGAAAAAAAEPAPHDARQRRRGGRGGEAGSRGPGGPSRQGGDVHRRSAISAITPRTASS